MGEANGQKCAKQADQAIRPNLIRLPRDRSRRGIGPQRGDGILDRQAGDTADRLGRDGRPAGRAAGLWFEAAPVPVPRRLIERTPRIGVGDAGDWADAPLRFVVDAEKLTTLTVRSEVTRRSSR